MAPTLSHLLHHPSIPHLHLGYISCWGGGGGGGKEGTLASHVQCCLQVSRTSLDNPRYQASQDCPGTSLQSGVTGEATLDIPLTLAAAYRVKKGDGG